MLVAIWWWLWGGFYLLDVGRDSITLRYYAPSRQRVRPQAEISAACWNPGPNSTHVLVIETRAGNTYRSAETWANHAFERRVTQAVASNAAR